MNAAPRTNGNAARRSIMGPRSYAVTGLWLIGVLSVVCHQPLEAAENCFPRGKSVTFVIPYRIGTLENFYARMIKTAAEDAIGSQFNPKNVPGRGTIEGMTELYSARPSGRVLGLLNGVDAVVAALAKAIPFAVSRLSIFGRVVDTPQAVYAGRSAFAKGIKSIKDAAATKQTPTWGITTPGSFFAAVVLDDLFGIDGKFKRLRGSARTAAKAAGGGAVDLVVMDVQSGDELGNGEIIPLLALGPTKPSQRSFEKHRVPMLKQAVESDGLEKALSLANITASGLMIAGPPHIPGLREKCIQVGFDKALRGPNLRALAAAAEKPIRALDAEAAIQLLHQVTEAARPFESTWVEALKQLNNEPQ